MHLRRWPHAIRVRLRLLVSRRRADADLDDELAFHLEMATRAGEGRGLSRPEAERRARQALQLQQTKERAREGWPLAWAIDFAHDLRYALRQVSRSPWLAALATLSLGVAIGANTAIFSALNTALFRPLPVADPDRLLMLTRGAGTNLSYPEFEDVRARSRRLSGLAASFPMESDLEIDGASGFVAAEVVSADYGAVLGAAPALGRWFTSEVEPAAVISYAVWQDRFGGQANVLGRRIGSEAQSYTIVGVAPRPFTGIFAPYRTDIWVPMRTRPRLAAMLADRSRRLVMVFGRLRPQATPAAASAELHGIDAQLVAEHGAAAETVAPLQAAPIRGIPNPGGRQLLSVRASLLMVVVGLVLLIACVNVANLLLVRGAARRRELATRQALGATRSRLRRQLLTESAVLALGGAAAGLVLAAWTTRGLERLTPAAPSTFPIQLDLSLDGRVLAFTTLLALTTTLACGLLPAWRGSGLSAVAGFKGEVAAPAGRRRPYGLLAQVVLSFVLLLLVGSVVQALRQLERADPGFAVKGRLYAYIYFPGASAPEGRLALYAQALERLRALPGVLSASQASALPLMPSGSDCAAVPGQPQQRASIGDIDGTYFRTMGIAMIAGREFTSVDETPGSSTVIVTQSLARRLWPERSAIGAELLVGCNEPHRSTVIAVVGDSAVRAVGEAPQPRLYRPLARDYAGGLTALLVESATPPTSLVSIVRQTLLGMGQDIRVYAVQPLSTYVDRSLTGVRWMAAALAGFGLLALLLAAIGLHGVIAYRVGLRTQEIGVRMALGAPRPAIFREVVIHGLTITLAGIAIGELLAIPATRALAAMQPGVGPGTLSAHAVIVLIWLGVAALACYGPASRASRLDPVAALRHD